MVSRQAVFTPEGCCLLSGLSCQECLPGIPAPGLFSSRWARLRGATGAYTFSLFGPCHVAYGILVPRPGIEPRPLAVKALSPNHWTARELRSLYLRAGVTRGHEGRFDTDDSLVWGRAVPWKVFGSIPEPLPLDARSTPAPPAVTTKIYLQTFPSVPWGAKLPPVKKHYLKVNEFLLFLFGGWPLSVMKAVESF